MAVLFQHKTIHFVGIGGIGMSGIAEILLKMGFSVQGSDLRDGPAVEKLRTAGAKVFIDHREEHIEGADVVVYSSACTDDNPEILAAHRVHVPVIRRAEMLAELMRLKFGVAIAGSHGKTTTTSLLGQITHQAELDPTVIIGGKLSLFDSNARHGKGRLLVAEADESDGSFLLLNPAIAVVTNIDEEHLNHYGSFDALKKTFLEFLNKVPFYGAAIVCLDCPVVQEIFPHISSPVRTYGFSPHCHYTAVNIEKDGLGSRFEVIENLPDKHSRSLGRFMIHMPGRHNILNALASIVAARELGIEAEVVAEGLAAFSGVERRLQYLMRRPNFWLIDDYGHHPTEIVATLNAVRENHPGRLVVLFQPHRFTRTRDSWAQFSSCFLEADKLFLMDIYPASEQPIEGIHSSILAQSIRDHGHRGVHYVGAKSKKTVLSRLLSELKPNDTLLTLGAGSTYEYALSLFELITKNFDTHEGPQAPLYV